ncbi:hypothetical protein [Legionella bononiensis]|uniref:Uncharacterized protein n=1 Tax=Legionella bononiensis TaxID=2793102 RepID=A0ABS1W6Q3_9GAMM|nr:hypothetical protein [Legionella bononiensis]MBL7478449.1 hypothetical protein [Legionella bononiensis]MBL7525046.1 hypothetical protein [Legionella bononiensis]MBL7561342.1 hypothetical protein [Legionella bononiensis]
MKTHHVLNTESFILGLLGFFSPKTKMPQPLAIFEAELEHLAARNVPEQAASALSL